MDSILQSIEDWFRELLVSGIMSNLSDTFDSVNNQVGQIASDVGATPANFSPAIFKKTSGNSRFFKCRDESVLFVIVLKYKLQKVA